MSYNDVKKDGAFMNIAVVTGASSGLGVEYVKQIAQMYPSLDEIWLVARRREKLEQLANSLPSTNCRVIVCDITSEHDIASYEEALKDFDANVKILINNAGFGRLEDFKNISVADNAGMVRLNCEALTVFTAVTLKFMKPLAQIINVSSIASFVPNARMAVYSSTKAYVTSFSRALRFELKKDKINVTAVCPGPMDTEFLPVANIEKGTSKTFDMLPRVNPVSVAKNSLLAAKRGRSMYTDLAFYKFYRFLAKIVPHCILMHFAKT